MKTQPTFTSSHHSDRSYVVLICRETGDRYSFTDSHPFDSVPIFRNGEVMAYRRGKAPCLAAIESDARWAIREAQREERNDLAHRRLIGGMNPRGVWL